LFFPAAAQVKKKTSRHRQKGKTMKLEEIKNKTKDAVDYLVQSLESGHSEVLTQYLGTIARFHTYSFGNVMLIARQKPDATNVAGIRTWNSLGRFVKRGEKGILILAPMVGFRRSRQNEIATDMDTDNAADERKPAQQLVGFRAVYVFDRLSRDLWPSLCALFGSRQRHFRKFSR
jgi:ribosomal protein L35AE/L33A